MTTCTEFAVFEVEQTNVDRLIALSETLFSEINSTHQNIIAHEILLKIENEGEHIQELCWHLTWANEAVVKESSTKWSSYPSSTEIESLVGKKLYYGHFVSLIAGETPVPVKGE